MTKTAIGLFLALACASAHAKPTKELIAARGVGGANSGPAYTANDYSKNGLVAMWDSRENIGWGKHSDSASAWVDLSDNGNNITVSPTVWVSGGYNMGVRTTIPDLVIVQAEFTIEVVFQADVWTNDRGGIFLCLAPQVATIGRYNAKVICSGTKKPDGSASGWPNDQFVLPSPYPRQVSINMGIPKTAYFDGNMAKKTTDNWTTTFTSSYIGSAYNKGVIQCIRVYNRVLTEEERQRNYQIDKERFGL